MCNGFVDECRLNERQQVALSSFEKEVERYLGGISLWLRCTLAMISKSVPVWYGDDLN